MNWENIHTFSYCHHEIGSMNYYPLFRVRSWNNGVRCMSFYILLILMNYYPLFRVRSWNNGMRCMSFYILMTEDLWIKNLITVGSWGWHFGFWAATQRAWKNQPSLTCCGGVSPKLLSMEYYNKCTRDVSCIVVSTDKFLLFLIGIIIFFSFLLSLFLQ